MANGSSTGHGDDNLFEFEPKTDVSGLPVLGGQFGSAPSLVPLPEAPAMESLPFVEAVPDGFVMPMPPSIGGAPKPASVELTPGPVARGATDVPIVPVVPIGGSPGTGDTSPSVVVSPPVVDVSAPEQPARGAPALGGPALGGPAIGYGDGEEKPVADVVVARGTGKVVTAPDSMHVDVGVRVDGASLDEAREKGAQALKAILDAVKGLGIEGLVVKTRAVGLQPIYERGRGIPILPEHMPKILGYMAHGAVGCSLKGRSQDELTAAASKILDAAVRAGANDVGGVDFGLDKPEAAAREALKLAVAEAREIAKAMADAAGVGLGRLHSVCEARGGYGGDFLMPAAAMSVRAKGAPSYTETPVEAGEITVVKSVTARWYFTS